MGQGFYTIGPCGEELIAAVGAILKPTDPIALHYRHIGAQVSRQLKAGRYKNSSGSTFFLFRLLFIDDSATHFMFINLCFI